MRNNSAFVMAAVLCGISSSMMAGCSNNGNPSAPQELKPPARSVQQQGSPAPSPASSSKPSEAPSSQGSSKPSATPSAEASKLPEAPQGSLDARGKTTVMGRVYDQNGGELENVVVKARSLTGGKPYEAQGQTINGVYLFNDVPAGVVLSVTATKGGYSSRSRSIVPLVNATGMRDSNSLDFGGSGDGAAYYLSDAPEVVAAIPARDASGVDPSADIKISFSIPMDRQSVLDHLQILVKQGVSVADLSALSLKLETPNGTDKVVARANNQFDASWNDASTELTLKWKRGQHLPTDRNVSSIPTYQLGFDSPAKSAAGRVMGSMPFRVNASLGEARLGFQVATDTSAPSLLDAVATVGLPGQHDEVKLRFSEAMLLPAGDFGNIVDPDLMNPNAYAIAKLAGGISNPMLNDRGGNQALDASFGAAMANGAGNDAWQLSLDTTDPSNATVRLSRSVATSNPRFNTGDAVQVRVNQATITDAAGNALAGDDSANRKVTTAR